ncbi:SWI/SNF chromatin-remodeling complex subunit sol1 [Metarhizium anisopliae]
MSAWMNDAVPNHNGNGFPHMNDPNSAGAMMDHSAFLANPGQFNPGQFPNQQQMAGMQNGPMRHGSPTYQNQNQTANPNQNQNQNAVYQTNPVIPSKRPRPREDSVTGSPGQNPGMQPPSRSETPQQNFGGFQPAGGAMPQQPPGQFPHLQPNGSANASPSPIMGNQMRPGNVPQRVATASPHPFSPGPQQQFTGSQASPIPSEHGTPQPNQYMQNIPPGYNPGYAQSPSNPRPSPNPNVMAGGPAGNMQMQAQMQAQNMGRGMMPKQQVPGMPNGQMPQGAMRQQPRPIGNINPEQFMKNLTTLMNAKGLPLDPNPIVGDRPVNLVMLFQLVQSKGGYKPVTTGNGWGLIAQSLGLPAQIPTVPPTLKQVVSVDGRQATPLPVVGAEQHMPRMPPKPEDYSPCARELSTHGGVDLHAANLLGAELERWEPTVPSVNELGNIDISALTRSLQCGIHGEVRLALDTLATISSSQNQAHFLHLRACDDLVEALVDCAESQVDLLVEHTTEVADEIQLTSYEDVVRGCRIERWAVRDVPAFGSIEYQLDGAVDRLICITTILRNVSFPGENNDNHIMLCEESVIKMLCSIIRYLGTRTMLLRTHANTLDFMKDIVVLLSNISSQLEIPGREQALSLLQFLLAFAPVPGPTMASDTLNFTPYDPSIHSYLPHAVDALAKLLARDEPNRGFYKTLFTIDSSSPLANELLVRTFALTVAPLPDKAKEQLRPPTFPPLFETRKPFLMQGLLGAEIIASLVPGSEPGMARALLASGNCLAQNLVQLIQDLCFLYEKPPSNTRGGSRAVAARKDPELVYIVVVAVSLLRRLAEKARDSSGTGSAGIGDLLPQPQMLMDALMMQSPEWTKEGLLPQLTAVLNLDG